MNKKLVLSSVLSIVLCIAMIAGGTFALFTSESTNNVTVNSGTVNVVATVEDLELYSPTLIADDATNSITDATNAATATNFANGGTAELNGSTLTLTNMTPGDKVNFNIHIENNSNVTIKIRTLFSTTDEGLRDVLVIKVDDYTCGSTHRTPWATKEVGEVIADQAVSIEMPTTADDTYQNKKATFTVVVEAVQGNTAESVADLSKLQGEAAKNLTGILDLDALNATLTAASPDLYIGDANLKQSGVTEIVFNGGVIDTPYSNGLRESNSNHGPSHIYNEVNGSMIQLDVPAGTKLVFKNLTVNGYYNFNAYQHSSDVELEFVNCTFNGCWVGQTNGLKSITFKGCTFTTDGIDTTTVKDTNLLWLSANVGQTLTLDGCTVEGNRPIKYEAGGATGATLNVTNTTFVLAESQYDIANNRPDRVTAIRFDAGVTNVNIQNNTMVSGYAFYQTNNAPYSDVGYDGASDGNTKPADALWWVEY